MNERTRPPQLLIVEDTDDTRDIIEFQLKDSNLRVDLASSGEEALALREQASARGEDYDLVLLDIHLRGGIDGFSVTRRMRAAGDLVPIIYLTATHISCEEARAQGAQDVWLKPEDLVGDLEAKVGDALVRFKQSQVMERVG